MQNSFPMREWHVKNMEKTIIKHVKGLSPDATKFERRMYKRYGGIHKVQMRIKYDIKHGVTNEQVLELIEAIKTDSPYIDLRDDVGCMDRLAEIESLFVHTTQTVANPRFL